MNGFFICSISIYMYVIMNQGFILIGTIFGGKEMFIFRFDLKY